MSEDKSIKLFTAAKELNIGTGTIVDFLATKGYKVQKHPMTLLDSDMYSALLKEFAVDKIIKEEAKQISIGKIRKDEPGNFTEKPGEYRRSRDFENEEILIKNTGHHYTAPPPAETAKPVKNEGSNDVLPGVKVVGKINLDNVGAKAQPAKEPAAKPEKIIDQDVAEQQRQSETVKDVPAEAAPQTVKPAITNEEKKPVAEIPVETEPAAGETDEV